MTRFDAIPVYGLEERPDEVLRLRVEANLGRRWVFYLFPSTLGASAETTVEP
jgi:hypothetical protein